MTLRHPSIVADPDRLPPPQGLGPTITMISGDTGPPLHVTDEPVKCPSCDRTVAWKATRPYRIACRHCKADVER